MKIIYGQLLVLCAAFQANAFVSPRPKTHQSVAPLQSSLLGESQATWDLTKIGAVERCEGLTRKTFSFTDISQEDVQLGMTTEGRPLNAVCELWIGPDWTPKTLKIFSEDGRVFPVQCIVGTRNKSAELEVRNVGPSEFPLNAACSYAKSPLVGLRNRIPDAEYGNKMIVQGGAVKTQTLDPTVKKARVFLKTDTRQLNARIELLNGPNNIKQQFEVFTNNGVLNSLYVVFETPGSGNTIRIVNQATIEFPAYAYIAAI